MINLTKAFTLIKIERALDPGFVQPFLSSWVFACLDLRNVIDYLATCSPDGSGLTFFFPVEKSQLQLMQP